VNYDIVYPQLYIGSAPHRCIDVEGFDLVVLAAQEHQPPDDVFVCTEILRVPLFVGRVVRGRVVIAPMEYEEKQAALHAADAVARRLAHGESVLSTCWMGLNRSSLVAAIAMLMLHPTMSANDAISLIRIARGQDALGNPYFVQFLRDYAATRRARRLLPGE
jgi:hypothetical protein